MKLNPDCIRDILMDIEETTTIDTSWNYDSHNPSKRLSQYDKYEVAYHTRQCYFSHLVNDFHLYGNSDEIVVNDLTPAGHQFLANIRENKIWSGVKTIAEKVGSSSLDAIVQISSNIITELIKAQFGLGTIGTTPL